MASAIEVLLTHKSAAGEAGELVRVKPGFARNFLFPKGLAELADSDVIAQYEERQAQLVKQAEELKAFAESNNEKLGEEASVTIESKAGASGKLFGAVTKVDISEAVKKEFDISVAKEGVILKTPVKTIGEHTVGLDLGSGIKTQIIVKVVNSEV